MKNNWLLLCGSPLALLAAAAQAADPPRPANVQTASPASSDMSQAVQGVVVTGQAAPVQTSLDRRSYSLGKDIQGTSGSVADALRNVPSLEVDLNGAVSLRGDTNVTILIDGKPSAAFEGANRAQVLSSMPADQIERVEVMTNPSAAMDANGSGGIINLITKKSRGSGKNGAAYATVGSAGAKRAGLTFGYNGAKLALTGSVAGAYQHGKSYTHEVRTAPDPEGVNLDHLIDGIGRNLARSPTARISGTYTLDQKNQLSGSYSYNHLLWVGNAFNHYEDALSDGTTAESDRLNRRRLAETDTGVSAGWRHSLQGDGRTLSIDLLQNRTRYGDLFHWTTVDAAPPAGSPYEINARDVSQEHSELRTVYARPLRGSAKLTLGYELKYDNNEYANGSAQGVTAVPALIDPTTSSDFLYRQTINAAYATFERPFGNFSLQAGLRLEDAHLAMDERASRQSYDIDYFRAYPTLHLAYKLDDQRKLTASYSRRVQRPPAMMLNPFRVYYDLKNYQQGNPYLKPQETDSFELTYEQHKSGNVYLATAFYRRNDREFTVFFRDLGDGAFLQTYGNLGSSQAAGLEMTANGKLSKAITYTVNATYYWAQISAANLGLGGDRSAFGGNARVNLNWQPKPNDLLQLNFLGVGKRLYPQGATAPTYTVNLGWRHKIDERTTATLSVQDLMDSTRGRLRLDTPMLRDRLDGRQVGRSIAVRLDYKLGSAPKNAARAPSFEYESPVQTAP